MPYYKICAVCGAYLDCGERCDCRDKETALNATNIQSGKAESELSDPQSASILTNT